MKRVMMWTMAAALLAAATFLEGAEYTVNGRKLEVSLVPDKAAFMVGEPIYLSFKICNRSAEVISVIQGGDTLNELGRPNSFKLEAISDQGVVIPMIHARPSGGNSTMGPRPIPMNDSYSFSLFLPHWLNFTEPGSYAITAKRRLDVNGWNPRSYFPRDIAGDKGDKSREKPEEVAASAKVTITPFDKAKMGRVIDEWAGVMLGKNEDAARRASKALAAINDERTIDYFRKAIDGAYYGTKYNAVHALEKFNSDAALAALNKAALNPDNNIRLSAAYALSRSPHPKAMAALLARRQDPYRGVRNVVVHALGRMQSAESLEMLRTMTNDADDSVRREAERGLKLRMQTATKPES